MRTQPPVLSPKATVDIWKAAACMYPKTANLTANLTSQTVTHEHAKENHQTTTPTIQQITAHTQHQAPTKITDPPPPAEEATMRELADDIASLIPPQRTRQATRIYSLAKQFKTNHATILLSQILALQAADVSSAIRTLIKRRNWCNATAISRINSLLALGRTLATDRATTMALLALRRDLSKIQTPAWEPGDEHQCLPPSAARELWKRRAEHPALVLPLLLSWILGQRVGDILLWRTGNVGKTTRLAGELSSLTILVVQGKTVPATGPYTIHVDIESETALEIQKLKDSRMASKMPYLFLDLPTLTDNHDTARTAARRQEALIKTFYPCDLRSCRRGGLSAMALQGLPDAQLQTLSRHPDPATLRRYLGAGRLNATEATMQMEAAAANEALLRREC